MVVVNYSRSSAEWVIVVVNYRSCGTVGSWWLLTTGAAVLEGSW